MEPEEIIQQKKWQELTDAERLILAPLAANEQDFYLLKRMLSVSAERAHEVPLIDPAIQAGLQSRLKSPVVQSNSFRWYYAAAAVIVFSALTWFYFNRGDRQETTTFVQTPGLHEKHVPFYDSVVSPIKPVAPDIVEASTVRQPVKMSNKPADQKPVLAKPAFSTVHALAAADTMLLAFITEAY